MLKKLLVFLFAFGLSLGLMRLLEPKSCTADLKTVSTAATSNSTSTAQNDKQISLNNVSLYKDLLNKFQDFVAKSDKETVASLINFPLDVSFKDRKNKSKYKQIKSKDEFLLNYDKIFDNSFKQCTARIDKSKLLFSTSGIVFTLENAVRMERIHKADSNDFEIKIVALYGC